MKQIRAIVLSTLTVISAAFAWISANYVVAYRLAAEGRHLYWQSYVQWEWLPVAIVFAILTIVFAYHSVKEWSKDREHLW